jgi:hypothetical protein
MDSAAFDFSNDSVLAKFQYEDCGQSGKPVHHPKELMGMIQQAHPWKGIAMKRRHNPSRSFGSPRRSREIQPKRERSPIPY